MPGLGSICPLLWVEMKQKVEAIILKITQLARKTSAGLSPQLGHIIKTSRALPRGRCPGWLRESCFSAAGLSGRMMGAQTPVGGDSIRSTLQSILLPERMTTDHTVSAANSKACTEVISWSTFVLLKWKCSCMFSATAGKKAVPFAGLAEIWWLQEQH